MQQSSSEDIKRKKQRFEVDLKAVVSPATQKTKEQQCRIKNLSATGACIHLKKPELFPVGMQLAVKIFVPSTILHATNTGEVKWCRQEGNECEVGIKFKNFISQSMMTQLLKKS